MTTMEVKEKARKLLSTGAMDKISERLSLMDNLYFPRAVQPSAGDPSRRKSILLDLLSRDAAVFLERYGPKLTAEELEEFEGLKEDYEIDWHLNYLRSVLSPTLQQLKSRSLVVKNRRRAYMDKLMSEGQYFSEDAMREREPYLHHEYVGKFLDPSGRGMARPGERWSETLMRCVEEAVLVAKIRGEQMRLGVAEREWVENERESVEEEEEDEKEEDDEDQHMEEAEEEGEKEGKKRQADKLEVDAKADDNANLASPSSKISTEDQGSTGGAREICTMRLEEKPLSEAEMQEQMDQFTYIMQQKFLSGEDFEHFNYSKIDEDERLDDHWMREADYDAEDRYFSEE